MEVEGNLRWHPPFSEFLLNGARFWLESSSRKRWRCWLSSFFAVVTAFIHSALNHSSFERTVFGSSNWVLLLHWFTVWPRKSLGGWLGLSVLRFSCRWRSGTSAVGFDITLTRAQIGDNKSTRPPLNLQNIHGYQLLDNQTFDEGDRQLPSIADPNPRWRIENINLLWLP